MQRYWIMLILAFVAALVAPLHADPPNTANTTDPGYMPDLPDTSRHLLFPTTQPDFNVPETKARMAQMEMSLVKANDPDPQVRQQARDAMMQWRHMDLPLLRAVAARQPNLTPEQLDTLQDVVRQLFLKADNGLPALPVQGFLGLHWSNPDAAANGPMVFNGPLIINGGMLAQNSNDLGVIVEDRIAGFDAYRQLQPGDIILQLVDFPLVDLRNRDVFISAIAQMFAGQGVKMKVARAAHVIDVTIVLSPRPPGLDAQNFDQWMIDRQQAASDYWNREFAPALHQHPTALTEK